MPSFKFFRSSRREKPISNKVHIATSSPDLKAQLQDVYNDAVFPLDYDESQSEANSESAELAAALECYAEFRTAFNADRDRQKSELDAELQHAHELIPLPLTPCSHVRRPDSEKVAPLSPPAVSRKRAMSES